MAKVNMQKGIQKSSSMQNGPRRQAIVKGLTTDRPVPKLTRPGKPLATLPSNSSVRKGKPNLGTPAKPSRARADMVQGNAKHRTVTKDPAGGRGSQLKTLGANASVAKGRMNTGGPARRVK